MEKFIPAKITDRKWAERLLDGEVFMRPLHDFGVWNKTKDSSVANQFRGDVYEGTSAVYREACDYPGLEGFPKEFRNAVKGISVTDYGDIQFFKVFCLYRLMYNPFTDFFVRPDPKMRDFGDTAVIIRDYNKFVERFALALFSHYKFVSSMIDSVRFFDFSTTRVINPLFEKLKMFEYQNELRMAFCELERDDWAVGPGAESALRIVRDLRAVTLNIGSIRDIAVAIPVDDFLKLRLPKGIRLRFPMSSDGQNPTNYDKVVSWTREEMGRYRTTIGKPMFVI